MQIIRRQQQVITQKEQLKLERLKQRVATLDNNDNEESEHVLAVRNFHEYDLTEEHLRVADLSLVYFF